MTEQEFLNKFNNNEKFTEEELENIAYEKSELEYVDEVEGERSRWDVPVSTIVKAGNRFFSIDWQRGLTECQDNWFDEQPYEVVKKEKVITVTEWLMKGEDIHE